MADVDQRKLYGLIETAIGDALVLMKETGIDDPDGFDDWRASARSALRVAFGDSDSTVASFDRIDFWPISFVNAPEPEEFVPARVDGLKKALALLRAARSEVSLRIPDDAPPSAAAGVLAEIERGHVESVITVLGRSIEGGAITFADPEVQNEYDAGSRAVEEQLRMARPKRNVVIAGLRSMWEALGDDSVNGAMVATTLVATIIFALRAS